MTTRRRMSIILLADELVGEGDEAIDIGHVADESERHADGAGALSVNANPEIIDRQMSLMRRLPEAGGQFGAGQAEGDFPAAGITEAAGAQRDVGLAGAVFDEPMIDGPARLVVEIEGHDPAAAVGCRRTVEPGERPAAAVPERQQVVEQPSRQALDPQMDRVDADRVDVL